MDSDRFGRIVYHAQLRPDDRDELLDGIMSMIAPYQPKRSF
jgi:hypothetical protein